MHGPPKLEKGVTTRKSGRVFCKNTCLTARYFLKVTASNEFVKAIYTMSPLYRAGLLALSLLFFAAAFVTSAAATEAYKPGAVKAALSKGQTVLMVEDIVTTGLSSRETIEAITQAGGNVVAGCCLFDRSGGEADIGVPLISLAAKRFPDYDPENLPPELAKMPAIKPGSRGLS